MSDVLRCWCPTCGKSAGRVLMNGDGELTYEGIERSSSSALMQRLGITAARPTGWRNLPFVLVLPSPDDQDDSLRSTCRGGHELVADLVGLTRAHRSGQKDVTLTAMRVD